MNSMNELPVGRGFPEVNSIGGSGSCPRWQENMMLSFVSAALLSLILSDSQVPGSPQPELVRSAASGRWSEAATWQGGKVPSSGARVQVRAGHVVTFDIKTDGAIRSIHVAGTLRFDPESDTRLDVGLIKIQAGDDAGESGFDCENHVPAPDPAKPRPAFEVGMPDEPISPNHTAVIRLTAVPGLDPEECPAIVCCGGRWDVHGTPLRRTWVKLAPPAKKGSDTVTLSEPVQGWRAGDRIVITAIVRQRFAENVEGTSVRQQPQTEERIIKAIDGTKLVLDTPLAFSHSRPDDRCGEVANLSRNVVIESADPAGVRGHTMYHRDSAGSISFAEFRHLGKEGKLGKYSLHFHRVGDTMRGASVIGASIWNSANRWITVHGTNTLVVRDCVGYRSTGHGFFLEDGTEVENIFDRNLAVQACQGKPIPGQVFAQDRNDGAGFWWANSHNAFTRNIAVECDEYGFRFDAPEAAGIDLSMKVRGPDGERRTVDIRTLPFLRFDDNEAHTQRRFGVNLGGGSGSGGEGGVGAIGPDSQHPFVIRNLHVWEAHWAFTPAAPGMLVDMLTMAESRYGLWRPRHDRHAYRNVVNFRVGFIAANRVGEAPDERRYPAPLDPVDDRPPVTLITRIGRPRNGQIVIRGVSVDEGPVRSVQVNGRAARSLDSDFLQWESLIDVSAGGPFTVTAAAVDAAGNSEETPHRLTIVLP
jgi:hypothetical protein